MKSVLQLLLLYLLFATTVIAQDPCDQPPYQLTFARTSSFIFNTQIIANNDRLMVSMYNQVQNATNINSLASIDADGNLNWMKAYEFPINSRPKDVVGTFDGGYAIVVESLEELIVMKTNPFGFLQWSYRFEDKDVNQGYSIVQTSDLGLVIAGTTANSGEGRSGQVIKLNSDGELIWSSRLTYNPPGNDEVFFGLTELIPVGDNLLMVGPVDTDLFSFEPSNFAAVLLNKEGEIVWAKEYELPIIRGITLKLKPSLDGFYILSSVDIDNSGLFGLTELDLDGNVVRTRIFESSVANFAAHFDWLSNGHVVISGQQIDIPPGSISGPRSFFLTTLNEQWEVAKAKVYKDAFSANRYINTTFGKSMVNINGSIYQVGSETDNGPNWKLHLARYNEELESDCEGEDFELEVEDLQVSSSPLMLELVQNACSQEVYEPEVQDIPLTRDEICYSETGGGGSNSVNLGPDIDICLGEEVSLSAGNFAQYNWTNQPTADCLNCPEYNFFPESSVGIAVEVATVDGCIRYDSIFITVNNDVFTFETQSYTSGETAIVFGQDVTENGVFTNSFFSSSGCDSIHEITVIFCDAIVTNDEFNPCAGEILNVFGNAVSSDGIYEETFVGAAGCDSTHQVTVDFTDVINTQESISICSGDTILVFGVSYTSANIVSETFVSTGGCDSIHQVFISLNEVINTDTLIVLCAGESVEVFGNDISEDATISQNFTAENGCDSIHQVTVEIRDVLFTTEELTPCVGETVMVFGEIILQDTVRSQTFIADNGCDSTHQVVVNFLPIFSSSEQLNYCAGDTAFFMGGIIVTDQFVVDSLVTSDGCDSLHYTAYVFSDAIFTNEQIDLCQGDEIFINGVLITEDAFIEQSSIAVGGCDSIHQINVSFSSTFFTEDMLNICEGDTVEVFGNPVFNTEILTESFSASNGCDSTHQVTVMVNTPVSTVEEVQACAGDTLFIFGNMVTDDDLLSNTFTAFNGCDSTHEVAVYFAVEIDQYAYDTLCAGDSLFFFDQVITTSGTYIENSDPLSLGCDTTYIITVEFLPTIEVVLPEELVVTSNESFDLPLQMSDGDLQYSWTPAELLSCDTCMQPSSSLEGPQLFSVTISNQLGCDRTAAILVNIRRTENIYIPNAFSPNGDANNDFFNIYADDFVLAIDKMQIFDRWGELIFEADGLLPNDPTAGWDGKFNGQDAEAGVYVYQVMLRTTDGQQLKTGDVIVLR